MSTFYHPKRLPANEDRIYKQRQYEEARQARVDHVNEYEHLMRCAEFEQSNEPKLRFRAKMESEKSVMALKARQLAEKRQRLGDLLREEAEALHCELHTATMNLSERRAWLEARGRQLREERIARDKTYADQQLDRVFREGCDDMRLQNSKMAVLKAEEIRKKQREANLAKKRLQDEERLTTKEIMELDRQRAQEEELQDLMLKKTRKKEAMEILQEQISLVQRLRDEERDSFEEEMRQLVRKWQDEDTELRALQVHRRQKAQQESQETMRYNDQVKDNRKKELMDEKHSDAMLVNMVSERERAEENQERQLREKQRQEAVAYAAYLKEVMAKQMADDAEMEAIIQQEVDEEWRRKDEEQQYQEEKRKRLMMRVHEEREAQLKFKEQLQRTRDEEKRIELEKLQAEMRAMELEKQRQSLEAKMSKQDLYQALQTQVRSKQAADLVAQSHARHEYEDALAADQLYEDKLRETLTLPYPEPNHGRKNAQWMF
ncbi:hypothetical protein SELMODRAFT_417142 [Selaginella moellendorffii]|uniref:Cilia- and flagella-associated protein 53 n=1 Tax=Selaginella moellendorffii TaxID=88036 RepID=D8S1I0_SELML|nr:hypothetical protein SELMODRAFT_417142 [Selaginella moellendorffii]